MNENVRNSIEELKGLVLDLHRSAGNLDNIVRWIENETDGVLKEEYLKVFILAQASYRRDIMSVYGDLDEKEKRTWGELINTLKKET